MHAFAVVHHVNRKTLALELCENYRQGNVLLKRGKSNNSHINKHHEIIRCVEESLMIDLTAR